MELIYDVTVKQQKFINCDFDTIIEIVKNYLYNNNIDTKVSIQLIYEIIHKKHELLNDIDIKKRYYHFKQ